MHRLTKLIHRHALHDLISSCLYHLQIPRQTGHFTGNVHNLVHSVIQDFRQSLWMNPVSWRIQDDHIRFFLNLIQHFKYVPSNKFTVGKSVVCSIFFGCLHSFLDNLHTDHLFCHRRQHLRDRPSSAEQIEHCHIVDISDIITNCTVKHFRPS